MDNFGLAFELMGVGMLTVSIILALVVLVGNLIIRFVNKYIPEEITTVSPVRANHGSGFNSKKMAAIVSAVNVVTHGTGKVTKIEKI